MSATQASIAKVLALEQAVVGISRSVNKLTTVAAQHGDHLKELFELSTGTVSRVEFAAAIAPLRAKTILDRKNGGIFDLDEEVAAIDERNKAQKATTTATTITTSGKDVKEGKGNEKEEDADAADADGFEWKTPQEKIKLLRKYINELQGDKIVSDHKLKRLQMDLRKSDRDASHLRQQVQQLDLKMIDLIITNAKQVGVVVIVCIFAFY